MGGADRRRSPEVPCVSSSIRVTRPFAIDVRGCTSILAPMSRRLSFSRCLVLAAAAAGLLAGASSCGGIVQNVDGSNGAFALGFAHAICDNIAPCCAEDSLASLPWRRRPRPSRGASHGTTRIRAMAPRTSAAVAWLPVVSRPTRQAASRAPLAPSSRAEMTDASSGATALGASDAPRPRRRHSSIRCVTSTFSHSATPAASSTAIGMSGAS